VNSMDASTRSARAGRAAPEAPVRNVSIGSTIVSWSSAIQEVWKSRAIFRQAAYGQRRIIVKSREERLRTSAVAGASRAGNAARKRALHPEAGPRAGRPVARAIART
jgi:hypothetical protein